MATKINLNDLSVDQAYLNITSYLSSKVWMYSLSEECVRCPYTKFKEIAAGKHILTRISTSHQLSWQIFNQDMGQLILDDDNETPLCSIQKPNLGQFGVYSIDINDDGCKWSIDKEPVNIYMSLLYVFMIVCLVSILIFVLDKFYGKFKRSRTNSQSTTALDSELDKPKNTRPRLKSLDTFRGIAIALMIFVNGGGGHYWWIEHATWNGLHVADLVFPWFLWIMGVCIPMSIKSQINRNVSKFTMIRRVFVRSVKLFLIGLCLNTVWSATNFTDLRIMGVLQRFGIAYFVVTTLHILLSRPIDFMPQSQMRRSIYDIRILCWQWIVMLGFVAVYLGITFGLPVPDCPTGYLGVGGKQDNAANPDCIGGATGYIDRMILGDNHLYQHGRTKHVYDSESFDPEGVFGCLMTCFQVFIGLQCGMTLLIYPQWQSRVKRWLLWAVVLGLAAGGLSGFTQDDGIIPINKNMWSISFVFATSSFAFILLSLCYLIVDVKPLWSGSPFFYAGMNAILLYIGHEVAHSMLPWHWRIEPMNTHFMLLLETTWCTSLWLVVAYVLYRKKFFYTV